LRYQSHRYFPLQGQAHPVQLTMMSLAAVESTYLTPQFRDLNVFMKS